MTRLSNIIFILTLSIFVGSCMHHNDAGALMDNAEAHLELHPDSAFVALDSLDRRELNTPELRARHALLYSIALEKCGISIMNDSIINIAVNYYSSTGDRERAEKALLWRDIILEQAENIETTDTLKRQNARIIQERYVDKLELVEKRRQTWAIILISLSILAFCITLIRKYAHRLKQKPDDKAMALISEQTPSMGSSRAGYMGKSITLSANDNTSENSAAKSRVRV